MNTDNSVTRQSYHLKIKAAASTHRSFTLSKRAEEIASCPSDEEGSPTSAYVLFVVQVYVGDTSDLAERCVSAPAGPAPAAVAACGHILAQTAPGRRGTAARRTEDLNTLRTKSNIHA